MKLKFFKKHNWVWGYCFVVWVLVILIVLMIFSGCQTPSEGNPFGIRDPNEVKGWIEFGTLVAESSIAVGTATGNPYALAWGGGLLAVGGVLAAVLFGQKKKE